MIPENNSWDISGILDHYQIQYRADRQGEQMIKCPVHEDRKPSCSLNLDKGLIKCHSCLWAGDGISLIEKLEEVNYATALEIYEGITGDSGSKIRSKHGRTNTLRVPVGQGYKPRINKRLPTGVRKRPDFGS